MTQTKILFAFAAAAGLAACDMPPAVTAFNGHSVTIVKEGGAREHPDVTAEANRICQKVGKRAEWTSIKATQGGLVGPVFEHFYLCL